AQPVERTGRVRLTIPNDTGAVIAAAPMSVGVPFPRGVLSSSEHVRLVDEGGDEVPVQVTETARWSRYGSVKWVKCDFTADLAGDGRALYLEYGPEVRRGTGPPSIELEARAKGFPLVRAGRLEVRADGVYFDAVGDGRYERGLTSEALN